ncbi:MAG: dUTP diphosphatase [Gammaproteobacteria bacterium]|nr:dUTP diphosphatase [Gammaproteobacteria bacterium]
MHPNAKVPIRSSPGAAGYDLYAIDNVVIRHGQREAVRTGVSMEIPEGMYGKVEGRSSLALIDGLDVGGGVIDSDFRGEIKVILFNHGVIEYYIAEGDRIGQIIFTDCYAPTLTPVNCLDATDRGWCGFGSTGK